MSIWAISDLHLSLGKAEKPMDIFGKNWENHEEKIKKNWIEKVKSEDLVLLPGDFSWSMHLQDTTQDFEYLNQLPGKKLLLKGNHDYWWNTVTKMRQYLKDNNFANIDFIYNNSYEYEGCIIAGTRGWTFNETTKDDKKIQKREAERLERSIKEGIDTFGEDKPIIVCMHYPPMKDDEETEFIEVMKRYSVETCLYGHLHGISENLIKEGSIHGIDFKMVSCDHTNFDLIKIK